MKTALILGAAAVVVYAVWRTNRATVTPGSATGDSVADMTPTGAAQTTFGVARVRGLLRRAVGAATAEPEGPVVPYNRVLAGVAAREFAPLATTPSLGSTRYSGVGIRGVGGTAPDGTPAGIGDPVFRRSN